MHNALATSARKDPALTGLGPLTELDFEHTQFVMRSYSTDSLIVQPSLHVTYTVVGVTCLENDVATTIKMVWREPAFTGIQPAPESPSTAGLEIAP